jgi:hypothetical protein
MAPAAQSISFLSSGFWTRAEGPAHDRTRLDFVALLMKSSTVFFLFSASEVHVEAHSSTFKPSTAEAHMERNIFLFQFSAEQRHMCNQRHFSADFEWSGRSVDSQEVRGLGGLYTWKAIITKAS